LLVARPAVSKAFSAASSAAAVPATTGTAAVRGRTVQDLEGAIEAELDEAAAAQLGEHAKVPVLTRRLSQMTQKQPEHAAELVRAWLQEDRR
jgi:flagellar biosynthesis/type III secretory pathway M-ring protein FliF/YscJ